GFCAELDAPPVVLDLGGGLGIRYTPEGAAPTEPEHYARALTERVQAALPGTELIFEPGRSLVGRAGMTLYRAGVVKRSGPTAWVAVDGGMSDNPRPALYGATYSALLANRADEEASGTYALCGK